jgi:Zn-finger nucleic acid-binding protein
MTVLTGAADVRFDWCEECEGMFFDKGELTVLEQFEAD